MGQSQQKIIRLATDGGIDARAPSLQQAELSLLYTQRSKRLKALADGHDMGDYLLFAADIVDTQEKLLKEIPFKADDADTEIVLDWKIAPLSKTNHPLNEYWLKAFNALLETFKNLPKYKSSVIQTTVEQLLALDDKTKNEQAKQLLAGNISATGSAAAPFYWAALSLYWAQLARQYKLDLQETAGVKRHICPMCASEPVASLITAGPPDGLRYLQCNLCESQWHYVRAQCSNCESSGKIHYWTLDNEDSPISTESCGDCGSHLKIFHQNKDASLEAAADDLASLALDALMEEKGFDRSTINPFLFPAEE